MIATAHLLVGCVLASKVNSRPCPAWKAALVAVIIGQLSHLVQDALPHLDPSIAGSKYLTPFSLTWYLAVMDNLVGFSLVAAWYVKNRAKECFWLVALATFSCWAPDLYVAAFKAGYLGASWGATAIYTVHNLWHNWWINCCGLDGTQIDLTKLSFGSVTTVICLWLASKELLEKKWRDSSAIASVSRALINRIS